MADERRSPSWRKTDWRGAGAASGDGAGGKKSSGMLRFVLLAAALAIVGVVAGLIMYLRPAKKPIFLSIAITEHVNRSLPPNPWGRQDGDVLRARFGKDSVQAFQSQERDLILRELAQLADRTTTSAEKKKPVIVHVSGHGVVRDNTIYLLAGFSQPDNPASWVPLTQIFDLLRRCAGSCLVLLDIVRLTADARLGFLTDDAGTAIHEELRRLEGASQLPFLVLASCAAGEVSHSSLVLQQSVFGYFVEQGLRGHADGWDAGGGKDGQVSARELAAYVRTQVSEWAAQHRFSAQTPALYGSGSDFVLITPGSKASPPQLPDPPGAYPEWLAKAWQARDQWLQDDSWRRVPRTFRQLESALVRAEERWLAGDEIASIQNELQADMSALDKQRLHFAPANHPAVSLAQAQKRKRKDVADLAVKLQSITDRLQSKAAPMAGEADMLWQKTFEKPPEADQTEAIAAVLFHTLITIPDPTREQLKMCLDVLGKLQPKPRHLEVQLLQLLVDQEPAHWQRWQELPGTAHVILHTGQLAEQVAAANPRCLPWIQVELAATDALRRDGVFALIVGEAPERRKGKEKLDDATKRYQALAAAVQALEQGFARQEEAWRLLPAITPELGRQSPDPVDAQLWSATVANMEKLTTLLTPPEKPQLPPVKEIESLAQDVGVQNAGFERKYNADGLDRQLRRLNTPNAPTAEELYGQLRSPIWNAKLRDRLYAAAAKLERETAETAINRANQLSPGSPMPANSEKVRDAPAWRARMAIDLLKLDGLSDTQSLQTELAKAQGSSSAGAWHDLGAKIRTAAAVTLVKRYKGGATATLQERAGWFVSTDELPAVHRVTGEPFEPAVVLRRKQQAEFWRWLGEERYLKDAALFLKFATRTDLVAYGKALNEVGRELPSRSP